MATRFASSKRAFAFCDKCAQRYPLKDLKKYYIMGKLINSKVCPECWDPDHPQNWVGIIGSQKVSNDPQALREPRPDTNRNDSCADFAFNPIATQQVNFYLNNVTISGFSSVQPGVVIVPPVVPQGFPSGNGPYIPPVAVEYLVTQNNERILTESGLRIIVES